MFCTVVCSAETVCAVLLIAPATALKFAFTSAAFAGVPATNVFGIVTASGDAPDDTLIAAIESAAATIATNSELRIWDFIPWVQSVWVQAPKPSPCCSRYPSSR
jgi:hypothetical protein